MRDAFRGPYTFSVVSNLVLLLETFVPCLVRLDRVVASANRGAVTSDSEFVERKKIELPKTDRNHAC